MFGGPHPVAWGLQGGLFTLFYALLPRPGVIFGLHLIQTKDVAVEAGPWGCLLCLAAGERGLLGVQGHTSQSAGLPLIV